MFHSVVGLFIVTSILYSIIFASIVHNGLTFSIFLEPIKYVKHFLPKEVALHLCKYTKISCMDVVVIMLDELN